MRTRSGGRERELRAHVRRVCETSVTNRVSDTTGIRDLTSGDCGSTTTKYTTKHGTNKVNIGRRTAKIQ